MQFIFFANGNKFIASLYSQNSKKDFEKLSGSLFSLFYSMFALKNNVLNKGGFEGKRN